MFQAIYVSAELSAPARQLPLAINTSVPTIILCFLTANAAYYILLPWNTISRTDSVAVVSSCSSTSLHMLLVH
jgi:L-asparagine transporter-like permease